MIANTTILALAIGGLSAMGAMANEAGHGMVAEAMGLGHNHMADYGDYHCAAHDGQHGPDHMQHMHNETSAVHEDCPGGGSMHRMAGASGAMHG